jgi:hypothetical protein
LVITSPELAGAFPNNQPAAVGVVLPWLSLGRDKRHKRTPFGGFELECGGNGMSEGSLRLNLSIVLGLLFGGKDR